jgi:hypothetical protein
VIQLSKPGVWAESVSENRRLYRIRARLQSCRERLSLPSALAAVRMKIRALEGVALWPSSSLNSRS